MSGVAGCFHRDLAPATAADLAPMARALAWRGADGHASTCRGACVLATWHTWTTAEELGEVGPRELPAAGLLLAFDGRLDNRAELHRALGSDRPLEALSDAELVLLAWSAWGEEAPARLLGPFALLVADTRQRLFWLARDPVGHRGLAFHLGPDLLLAASDEHAIAADPRVGDTLDENMLAQYFSLAERVDGRTFFRGIEQVLPGELLRVGPRELQRRYFYRPRLDAGWRTSEDWQEAFRETLRLAVLCRLRTPSPGQVGVLLSGGLDSTAIAAMASTLLPGDRLSSFTWTFPAHPECDESAFVAETVARLGLEAHAVPCDDAGPLAGFERPGGAADWPTHPGTPEQNAYRLFHQRAYAAARSAGTRVLLSGMGGDQLYSGADAFVADLLHERRYFELPGELFWYWRRGRLRLSAWRDLLPARALWWRRRRRRAESAPWLTARALALLPENSPWPAWAADARRPEQVVRLFDPTNAHGINVECYYALRLGVAPRYPWRDLRILELAMQLPGVELRKRDVTRPILRRALRHMMPQNVIERNTKTSFEPIFRQSLQGERRAQVAALLDRPGARWPDFVSRAVLDRERGGAPTPLGALLIWMCLALELWLVRRESAGP